MIFALIVLTLLTILLTISIKMNHKTFFIVISIITVIATVMVCVSTPKMHDRISLNIIDYLIKFNTDGSMTTTKQVTTEVLQEVQK